MTFRLGLALVTLVAATGALLPTSADAVHETTGRCLVGINKEFQTIQSAVDFPNAALGEVGPPCLYVQMDGTVWREQIVIRHSLTLAGTSFRQGETVFTTTLEPPPDATGPVTLVKIIGRKVKVKMKHLIFRGPLTSGDSLIGIDAGKDTRLTIRDSFFLDIEPSPLDGRGGFIGIQVGTPTAVGEPPQITFADISATRFEGFQNSAMVFQGVGTTGSVLQTFVSAGTGSPRVVGPVAIHVRGGAAIDIVRNDVVDARGPGGSGVGIALEGAGVDTVVMDNNIDRNGVGIAVDGTAEAVIYRNGFDQNRLGIALGTTSPVTDVTVSKNRVEAGVRGIRLMSGTKNAILTNHVLANTGVGVELGADTSKNSVSKNRTHNNGGLGFIDPTTGLDRSGTANFWRSNRCHGNNDGGVQASPPKLCILDD
jgi:hypothetical protein